MTESQRRTRQWLAMHYCTSVVALWEDTRDGHHQPTTCKDCAHAFARWTGHR